MTGDTAAQPCAGAQGGIHHTIPLSLLQKYWAQDTTRAAEVNSRGEIARARETASPGTLVGDLPLVPWDGSRAAEVTVVSRIRGRLTACT